MIDIIILAFFLIITEFFISLVIAATSKKVIKIIIGVEILINTANAFLVFFSVYFANGRLDPFVVTIVMISTIIAAIVAAFVLIIVYMMQEKFNTLNAEKISELRW